MHRRFLACLLVAVAVAISQSQSMTVQQLMAFIRSEQKLIQEGKDTDRKLAGYLANVRLTEKLDAAVFEDLQAAGLGAQSVKALEKLQEQSRGLKAAVIQQTLPDNPIPIPTAEEQGRILEEVRKYVRNYDNELPDFICAEFEQRAVANRTNGTPSYRPVDSITSKLTYFNHREVKTPVLHDSRPVTGDYASLGGSTSQGDFATMLQSLFDPASEARFEWARWTTWHDRLTMVFSFQVSQPRSRYRLQVPDKKLEIVTAYSGEVFVNVPSPHEVVRLVTNAEEIPTDFPLRRAKTILNYESVDIGGRRFLLPYYEEVQLDSADGLSKNTNSFQNYRKYEVGSEISFDIPKDMSPNSDANLRETAPVKPTIDCKDPKNKGETACRGKQ